MQLHLTIDFAAIIARAKAPWTEPRLRAAIATMAERGVQAIHWHDHGGPDSGLWNRGSGFDELGDSSATMRALGDPLPIVCDEAKRHGLQVLAIVKPFDMARGVPVSSYPVRQGPGTGLSHVGGESGSAARWIRDHDHLRTRLHPSLLTDESSGPIQTIRLWHLDEELPPTRIQVLVSETNDSYRPYDGPGSFHQDVRRRRTPAYVPAPLERDTGIDTASCLEFTGLAIDSPFVVLKPSAGWQLSNSLAALLEVEDAQGNSVSYTYGLVPLQSAGRGSRQWDGVGPIAYDATSGTPVPDHLAPASAGGRVQVTAADLPFVAFARGRNAYPLAMVDPAYPEVRQWIVSLAERALASGAHGIELRFDTHTETLDSENYGFSQPVIDAYRERHGLDISRQPFDRAAWRALRGEYLTKMVEELATAVHDHQRQLHLQLRPGQLAEPHRPSYGETTWQWPDWLGNGLADAVSCAEAAPRSPFAKALRSHASEADIPVTFSRRPSPSRLEADWLTWFREAHETGYDAVDLDHLASLAYLGSNGHLVDDYPHLWQGLRQLIQP